MRADIARRAPASSTRRVSRRELLEGATITELRRHGKQMALVGSGGAALCVQLGMTGQLRWLEGSERASRSDHVHCCWRLLTPTTSGRLLFRDPRRFGGLTALSSSERLHDRWSRLGPDALTVGARALRGRLAGRNRAVKTALLDQTIIAGLGNIYADECLYAARIHPLSTCGALPGERIAALARAIRDILARAIAAGGTTLRDYVDAGGARGAYVRSHRVYGRSGRPCRRCVAELRSAVLAQRTTTWCDRCQVLY